MAFKEFEIKKLYYSIGEIAEMFGVNASLIRFWEKEFEILQPKKSKSGTRRYTQEDIDNFQLVYLLVKEKGYTLEGAKQKIKEERTKIITQQKTILSLKKIKILLQQIESSL
jgi:DNA-binding transcriptional MerR regulator